ncbi:hypothetical protein B0H34DRAFT_797808 [Crassisporium funariophilum]|nr:hypothetical protein B0H34DRAFT_797808 [Crassisporium funariophilum]
MTTAYFTIPLSFPSISSIRADENERCETRAFLESSLTGSRPTVLEHWVMACNAVQSAEGQGLVLGCQDGTLYVFQSPNKPPSNVIDTRPPEINEPLRPKTARISKASHSNSQSASPTPSNSVLSPTFNVTAKPRVVSGITTEKVEAPKNYVDFEDEPDKLKDILKGKQPRERYSVSDSGSDRTHKSTASSVVEPVLSSKRKNPGPRSLLSATNSRAPTPPIYSAPASPRDNSSFRPPEPANPWALRYRIIPSRSGVGHAVRSIQVLENGRFLAVLQETGDMYVFSSDDGSCLATAHAGEIPLERGTGAGAKESSRPQDTWQWCNLTVSYFEETIYLVAAAATDMSTSAPTPDMEEGSLETSQCVIFEFVNTPSEVRLAKLAQWEFDGPAKGLGIHMEEDGDSTFFSISRDGHFITRVLKLRPLSSPPMVQLRVASNKNESDNHHHHHHTPHLSTLPIPNPFKSMMSRSGEYLPLKDGDNDSDVQRDAAKAALMEPHDIGFLLTDPTFSGLRFHRSEAGKLCGIAWAHRELTMFEYQQRSFKVLFHSAIVGIREAAFLDHGMYALSFENRTEVYRSKLVNADNEEVDANLVHEGMLHIQPELVRTIDIGHHDTIKFSGAHEVIISRSIEADQQLQILSYSIHSPPGSNTRQPSQTIWETRMGDFEPTSKIALTSVLPLELGLMVQGYSDGRLRQFSVAQIARKSEKISLLTSSSIKTSNLALAGYLTGLHVVQNPRTREKYILGGVDDGSIAFWSMSTFELVARWTVFITPLIKVLQFENENSGTLRGCVLCISRDGTIAVIVIDGFQFMYLVPGSAAPLKRICLGGHNLLLIYGDQRARLWDAQTRELWRSMGLDKAEELLAQGGWSDLSLEKDACVPHTLWTPISDAFIGQDAAASLSFNLERFIIDSIAVTKSISTSKDEVREILLTLDRLQLVLSALITSGLNEDVDSICYGKLGAFPSSATVGLSSATTTTLYQNESPRDVWCISSDVSASRALAIISVLRAMSLFEELAGGANTVISFYSTLLGPCVGPQFKAPSLEFLARQWFDASNELRLSIRTLFDATAAQLSDEEATTVAEKWQHHVPSLQPDAEKETLNAAMALFICGCVASEKYSLLTVNALTDISKSISLYLHDEKSIYRVLAIDLCSRGFHVWQHYTDSMEILRSLFSLSTSMRKDAISIQNVGAQARFAVLAIASNSMPLLMGTLCLDILTPPSMEHRRSVLQILAFLIKKRPHVLQPNLPRLMEAVVKSLDPNSNTNRELVLDSATEIIGYVVKTFPTVDFHMATQRLAVGTNEGAVVMYDLKTAIRLYVLESHKKQITACSFSPDGRRLVTISLQESSVLVWKVGSSFASFFNPGAPPRQGHGGSQPFKTLSFNIGSEANMTTAETLDLVRVEWVADRSVKVKIRESVLTFST